MSSTEKKILSNSSTDENVQGDLSTGDEVMVKRNLVSPMSCVLMLAGSIIGTGIFMSSNVIVKSIPSIFGTLAIWVCCGLVSLLAGLCYAELGLIYRSCGGEYIYFMNAYNEFAGFSFMFCNFLFIKPISIAILVLFTASSLIGMGMDEPGFWPTRLLSIAIVLVMLILHSCSDYLSIKFNDALTWSKFICMGIIVGMSVYKLCLGEVENIKDWGFSINITAAQVSVAIYNCMWSFDGFNQLAYMVEDMKKPEKYLLLTSALGLGLVTGLYVLINFSYFIILGVQGMVATSNVADAVSAPYMGKWKAIVVLLVALSALGSANATAYCGAKIYFDAARNKHLPKIVAAVHRKRRTVIPSLFIQALLTSFFLLVAKDIEGLLLYFSGASWVFYAATIFCVVVLRHRNIKRDPKAFRVNYFVALLTALVSASFVVLGFIQDWFGSLMSVAIIFASLPIYFIFVHKGGVIPQKAYLVFDKMDNFIMDKCNLEIPAGNEASN